MNLTYKHIYVTFARVIKYERYITKNNNISHKRPA